MSQDTHPAFHIDADDLPSGYLLSRREALTLLGGVGAAAAVLGLGPSVLAQSASPGASAAASAALPACVIRPELTEGPYYVAMSWNAPTSGPTVPPAASRREPVWT